MLVFSLALSLGPARAEGIRLEALQIPADIPGSNGRGGLQRAEFSLI